MIKLDRLLKIAEYALNSNFKVRLSPNEDYPDTTVDMKICYSGTVITYRQSDDAIFVEGVKYNGNLDNFHSELLFYGEVEKIGKMIEENIEVRG